MTTWTDIFPDVDGPPVKGVPAEFTAVAKSFTTMSQDASKILEQFTKIMSDGGVTEIQGDVAAPLSNFVDEVSDRLDSLPKVATSAAGVFTNHATKLQCYRDAADTALANAITKWNAVKTAKSNLSTASTEADKLKGQLASAPPDDPSATSLQTQHTDAAGKVTSLQSSLTGLQGELKAYRTKWTELRKDESSLRGTTIGDLDDIDLHDLEDPGWFDSFCEAAFEVVKFVYNVTGLEDLVDLIDAIAHGDWARALWALRGLLDKLIVILSIVVLFVCPALFLVILVLAVAKLAVDAILYTTNTANPDTGQRITLTDLAFDVLDVALAGKDFKGATAAMRLGKPATELAKGRQFADDAGRFLDRSGDQLTRSAKRRSEQLLRRYHIEPNTTTILRGNRPARYIVRPGNLTKFTLKAGEHVLQDGHDIASGGVQLHGSMNAGPQNEDITRTMDPDKSRPYFVLPSGEQMLNVLEIPLTR